MATSVWGRSVVGQMAQTPWPYRAITAPITTLLALHLAAGVAHWVHVPWYWVTVPGLFLAVVAGMASIAAGMGRAAAIYAAITTALSAAWMSYATATTPYSLTSIGVLLAGGILVGPFFGVLRYMHRAAQSDNQPAGRVEGDNTKDPWVLIFARVGYPGSVIARDDSPDYGYRLHVQVSAKASGDPLMGDLAKKLEQAAAALLTADDRLKRGAISVEAGEYANEIIVHVNTVDVFATDLTLPNDHTPRTIKDPIELGRYIDMAVMEVTFPRDFHMTIVGATGSGKSVLLNNLIHGITRCTDALVWMSATDKGLPIVAPWLTPYANEGVKYPLLDWASISIPESARMLLMLYKTADLRSRKPRGGKSKIDISPSTPAVVGIFEEAPGLLRDPRKYPTHNSKSMTASELLHEVTRLGRSEAVYAVTLAQYGTGEMLGADGPKMKVNFGARAGLRTGSSRENPYVFPDDNIPLHRLVNPGEVYLSTRITKRPKLGRGFALEDDMVTVSAREHARYRPTLEADIAAGLGKDYTERWSNERAGELIDAIRFNTPVEVGSVAVMEDPKKPETGGGLPAMPRVYKPSTPPPVEEGTQLPKLPPRYETRKTPAEPAADDVERMFTQVEDLLRAQGPQLTDTDKRSALLRLLEAAGSNGIRTSELQTQLQNEGAYPARGTFFRWLSESAVQVRHGVWAIKQGPGS
jgi:hypothetical protein